MNMNICKSILVLVSLVAAGMARAGAEVEIIDASDRPPNLTVETAARPPQAAAPPPSNPLRDRGSGEDPRIEVARRRGELLLDRAELQVKRDSLKKLVQEQRQAKRSAREGRSATTGGAATGGATAAGQAAVWGTVGPSRRMLGNGDGAGAANTAPTPTPRPIVPLSKRVTPLKSTRSSIPEKSELIFTPLRDREQADS